MSALACTTKTLLLERCEPLNSEQQCDEVCVGGVEWRAQEWKRSSKLKLAMERGQVIVVYFQL